MIDYQKSGFVDGLFNRYCRSPDGWQDAPKYLKGYMAGKQARERYGITMQLERTDP